MQIHCFQIRFCEQPGQEIKEGHNSVHISKWLIQSPSPGLPSDKQSRIKRWSWIMERMEKGDVT